MNSWTKDKGELEKLARQFDKSIKLHNHNNLLSKILAFLFSFVSFGKVSKARFLNNFAYTFGNHHFYPEAWTVEQVKSTLPHEARHTYQMRVLGLMIHPLLGLSLFLLIYLLLPFPIGLAFGRLYLELDADKALYQYYAREKGIVYTNYVININKNRRIESLSGPSYLWAASKKIVTEEYNDMIKKVYI